MNTNITPEEIQACINSAMATCVSRTNLQFDLCKPAMHHVSHREKMLIVAAAGFADMLRAELKALQDSKRSSIIIPGVQQ